MSEELNNLIGCLDGKLFSVNELRSLDFKLTSKRVVGLRVFEYADYTFLFNQVSDKYELALAYKIE